MVVVDVARQRVVRTLRLPRPGHATGRQALAGRQHVLRRRHGRRRRLADRRAARFRVRRVHPHRRRRPRPLSEPRRAPPLRHQSRRRDGQRDQLRHRTGSSRPGTSRTARPTWAASPPTARTLWLSGRYRSEVYAIDTRTGRLRAAHPRGHRARTASASGRNPAATRSGTRASCAGKTIAQNGTRRSGRVQGREPSLTACLLSASSRRS